MLQRLLEAYYLKHRLAPTAEQQGFLLRELRTPELLVEAVQNWPALTKQFVSKRPLLTLAQEGKIESLEEALLGEERAEREQDRLYWQPLKAELEQFRHSSLRGR